MSSFETNQEPKQDDTNSISSSKKDSSLSKNKSTFSSIFTDIKEGYTNDFGDYLTKSNFILTIAFLAIYIFLSFLVKFYFQSVNNEHDLTVTRLFDIIVLVILIIVIAVVFSRGTDDEKEKEFDEKVDYIVSFVNYKYSTIIVLMSIIVLYLIIYLFNIPMTFEKRSIFIFLIELINWVVLFICLLNLFFNRVFDFSLIEKIADGLRKLKSDSDDEKSSDSTSSSTTTTTTVTGNTLCGNGNVSGNGNVCANTKTSTSTSTTSTSTTNVNGDVKKDSDDSDSDSDDDEPSGKKEVYNVSNNLYNYEEAQAICKAYGADMASYDQLEQSYEDGAEWCNYGWSDKQMIFFPTQKKTWNELQKNENTKNNCGRPGVNGGYMSNPYLKFGVNCYGVKPSPTAEDLLEMKAQREKIYAKTTEDKELEKKVDYWKQNSTKLLNLNSFNNNEWSKY